MGKNVRAKGLWRYSHNIIVENYYTLEIEVINKAKKETITHKWKNTKNLLCLVALNLCLKVAEDRFTNINKRLQSVYIFKENPKIKCSFKLIHNLSPFFFFFENEISPHFRGHCAKVINFFVTLWIYKTLIPIFWWTVTLYYTSWQNINSFYIKKIQTKLIIIWMWVKL